jgi:hypothetical protein
LPRRDQEIQVAKKTIVQLIDDLNRNASEDIRTVTFGLDGATYEIDLDEANAASFAWDWRSSSPTPAASADASSATPLPRAVARMASTAEGLGPSDNGPAGRATKLPIAAGYQAASSKRSKRPKRELLPAPTNDRRSDHVGRTDATYMARPRLA